VVSAYRLLAVLGGGAICVMIHGALVSTADDAVDGYRRSGTVFAILVVVITTKVFHCLRERFVPEQERDIHLTAFQEVKTIFTNRAFICTIIVYLCGPTAIVLIQTNIFMYSKYIIGNENFIMQIMVAVQGTALLSAPFWILFGKRFGKRSLYFVGGPVLIVSMCNIWFVGHGEKIRALVIASAIGFGVAVVYIVPYSFLPDVVDDDELRTGKRREGIFSGFFTVSLKLSVALALTLTNVGLRARGYHAPQSTCARGNVQLDEDGNKLPDSQSPEVLAIIRALAGPIPAALIFVAMVFVWKFPINKREHEDISRQVQANRLSALHENIAKRNSSSSSTIPEELS
jgi:GPH family glycoside/pentoside/hexuronide:cation symporter